MKTAANRRIMALILIIFVSIGLLSACSSSNDMPAERVSKGEYYNGMVEEPQASPEMGSDGFYDESPADADFNTTDDSNVDSGADLLAMRKIIKTYSYSIETKNFDETLNNIRTSIDETQGYILFSNVYASGYSDSGPKRADLQIRIPVQYVPQFREQLNGAGKIINQGEESEDVTNRYYDTEQRIQSLEGQLNRLNSLYERAEIMADIIEVQTKIEDVTRELEYLKGQKSRMDHYVDFSTISIHLAEVKDYTHTEAVSKSLGERISDAFSQMILGLKRGGENFIVNIVYYIPGLLIFSVIILVLVLLVRKRRRRKNQLNPEVKSKRKGKRFKVEEIAVEEHTDLEDGNLPE